jgi:hypothetical protein
VSDEGLKMTVLGLYAYAGSNMWDEAAGFASKIFKNVNGIHDLNGVIPEHQMELTRQLAIEAFANAKWRSASNSE